MAWNVVLRTLLGLGVVVFISFLYPNNIKFPYEFERGQTWRYNSLYAPYQFPVRKTEQQLAADRQNIEAEIAPVYLVDLSAERATKQAFLKDFEASLDSVSGTKNFPKLRRQAEEHRRYGLEVLDQLFSIGLLGESRIANSAQVVSIAKNNEIRKTTKGNLFTLETAQNWLIDSLPYSQLSAPDFILPMLVDHLRPNLIYSDSLTNHLREQSLQSLSSYTGLVEKGDLIISQGSIITEDINQQLLSYKAKYNKDMGAGATFSWVFLGYVLLTGLIVLLLFRYLRHFYPLIYGRWQKMVFILIWLALYALLVWGVEQERGISTYVVPFCIVPIVLRIFFNERLAFFVHILVVLIASFLTNLGYEFTFLHILAGIVVIIMNIDTRDWSRFFNSLFFLFIVYAIAYFGLHLIREGNFTHLNWNIIGWLGFNVFLVLLSYPLIPLLERLFGLLSPITLTELGDMNRPLLRELAMKAPGTLQHSLNVANMCEQAARKIGADSLLLRTAALYHDIGKTANPTYFIENQNGQNPHDGLDEKTSAGIIISHVNEGVKMAKKAKLPEILIQFIRSHHGDSNTAYFFKKYRQQHSEEAVDVADFQYPGPKPVSKEEAILMLADSTEAACKSLKNPSAEELEAFVNHIFEEKINGKQLEASNLSFRELEICRQTFQAVLKSAHHVRISYPT